MYYNLAIVMGRSISCRLLASTRIFTLPIIPAGSKAATGMSGAPKAILKDEPTDIKVEGKADVDVRNPDESSAQLSEDEKGKAVIVKESQKPENLPPDQPLEGNESIRAAQHGTQEIKGEDEKISQMPASNVHSRRRDATAGTVQSHRFPTLFIPEYVIENLNLTFEHTKHPEVWKTDDAYDAYDVASCYDLYSADLQ